MDIILASASPRRMEILKNTGVKFSVCPANVDETTDKILPQEIVSELSERKANALDCKDSIIIAADTVVAIDGMILGKPGSHEDAKRMLSALSGNIHQVYTSVTVKSKEKTVSFCEKTDVYFKKLTEKQINDYIKTGEPSDKAGGYAIQGLGAVFIEKIEGDYLNVVGLPLSKLYDVLCNDFNYKGFEING